MCGISITSKCVYFPQKNIDEKINFRSMVPHAVFSWYHPFFLPFRDLIRFLKKNKHFPTAKGHGELRNWLNDQRRHKRRNGKGLMTPLTDERIKLLNDVDFNWESNPPDGEAVDETKINAAWSSRLSLSHQSSDDVPEVDNSTSLDNVGQAADTSEMVQDYGMSDSNVRMEEDMVLGAGETEFTDMLQDDDEIATETAQV